MKAFWLLLLFFQLSIFNCQLSIASCDPINLTVTKTVSDIASLSWTPVVSNISNGYYKIYREYPVGVWNLLDSTTAAKYSDKITICGDTLKYRIEIEDVSG